MKQKIKEVILASSSPRRLQLLQSLGLSVQSFSPDVDESPLTAESPRDMVIRLARLKANAVNVLPHIPVIGADTTVCFETHVLGKPKDKEEAVRILTLLSGQEHEVLTGYAVKLGSHEEVGCETTKVSFRKLSQDEILAYIQTGEPFDKAGAYGIQGWGASLIDQVKGSYTNVMGLPLKEIQAVLRRVLNLD